MIQITRFSLIFPHGIIHYTIYSSSTALCVTVMKSKFVSRFVCALVEIRLEIYVQMVIWGKRERERASLFPGLPYSQLVSSATGLVVHLFEQLKIIRLKIIVFGIVDVGCSVCFVVTDICW